MDKSKAKKNPTSETKKTNEPESKKVKVKVSEKNVEKNTEKNTEKNVKESKPKSSNKKSKESGTKDEKKTEKSQNAETKKAGTIFDVAKTRKWMKKQYTRDEFKNRLGFKKTENEDDSEPKEKMVMLKTSPHAITAVDEVVCSTLIELTLDRLKEKDKTISNLYEINEDLLKDSIKMNQDYNFTFGKYLFKYDPKTDHGSNLSFFPDRKCVNELIEKQLGNVKLTDSAHNFLMYLVTQNRIMLSTASFEMICYAKKSSLSLNVIECAVKLYYDGLLHERINKKLEDVGARIKEMNNEESSEKDQKEDKPKKSSDKSEKDKKVAKKMESDNEEEEDEEDEENDDDEEEEDEDED